MCTNVCRVASEPWLTRARSHLLHRVEADARVQVEDGKVQDQVDACHHQRHEVGCDVCAREAEYTEAVELRLNVFLLEPVSHTVRHAPPR